MNEHLAVVVLSGGLDSATALGIAEERHSAENTHAISFSYGQKHHIELRCAEELSDYYNVEHKIIQMAPVAFKGGVLTTDREVPDMHYSDLPSGAMSPTYVPFRNGSMLSIAAAYADSQLREDDRWHLGESWDGALLYAGMHSEDAAGFAYADCTPEFLGAMAAAIHVGTYGHVRLHALFQFMEKWEIIQEGIRLGVPYQMTHSCYRGERPACGACSTCHARLAAFDVAGAKDPIEYASEV